MRRRKTAIIAYNMQSGLQTSSINHWPLFRRVCSFISVSNDLLFEVSAENFCSKKCFILVVRQCQLSSCILGGESLVVANLCPWELLLTPATHAPQIVSNAPQSFHLPSARNAICQLLLKMYSRDVFVFVTQFAGLACWYLPFFHRDYCS